MGQRLISWRRAQELKLPRYFTGKPCLNGHIAERDTATCLCVKCKPEVNKRKKIDTERSSKLDKLVDEKISIAHKKETRKQYYANNKDKSQADSKEWKQNNKKRLITYNKEYYEANKDDINRKHRDWNKTNKAQVDDYNKRYYQKHKERLSKNAKERHRAKVCNNLERNKNKPSITACDEMQP